MSLKRSLNNEASDDYSTPLKRRYSTWTPSALSQSSFVCSPRPFYSQLESMPLKPLSSSSIFSRDVNFLQKTKALPNPSVTPHSNLFNTVKMTLNLGPRDWIQNPLNRNAVGLEMSKYSWIVSPLNSKSSHFRGLLRPKIAEGKYINAAPLSDFRRVMYLFILKRLEMNHFIVDYR
jgi:hypothetical protein